MLRILLLIPFVVLFVSAYADDDNDYSDFEYEWKVYKDGSFEYNYEFKDNSESSENYISKDMAYNRCYTDGQLHAAMPQPFDDMYPVLLYESNKLQKQCGEGYKDGYYSLR